MLNAFLDVQTIADIDKQVSKVLRDLGEPEPPLNLEAVRELLRLDRAYYSSTDTGVLEETIHRLRVAGRQIMLRPRLLLDVVKKLDLKALWVPDRRRILIDQSLPTSKQRWAEGHEVTHSIIPWHQAMLHGDKETSLSLDCHRRIEQEANYGTGRLLFLMDRFEDEAYSGATGFSAVQRLSKAFGNTLTSTLWRYVENHQRAAFGLVGEHPRESQRTPAEAIRYFVGSRTFLAEFPCVSEVQIQVLLQGCCRAGKGPIGAGECTFENSRGEAHAFGFETFFNGYQALTLGWVLRPVPTLIAVGGS